MIVGGFLAVISVLAETRTWIGTENSSYRWNDAANWKDGAKPTAEDTASFLAPPAMERVNIIVDGDENVTIDALEGFQIAGADGKFAWAEAKAVKDKVAIAVPNGLKPAKVRYAWDFFPDCNLVNGEGLPCGSFELEVK